MPTRLSKLPPALFVLCSLASSWAQTPAKDAPQPITGGDIPAKYANSDAGNDYVKREVMIPMRDGVKLFTVIVVPKGAHNAPIVLTRTPYDASHRMARMHSNRMRSILGTGDDIFADGDYIRVFQDVRGKYGSEGLYVMTRPVRGPL